MLQQNIKNVAASTNDNDAHITLTQRDKQGYDVVSYRKSLDMESDEFQQIDNAITSRLSSETTEVAFSQSFLGHSQVQIKTDNSNFNDITLKPHTYPQKAQSLLTFTKNMEQPSQGY